MEQKIILFGAGKRGLEALEQFGDKVVYFCDNDFEKIGQFIEGKEVISFNEMVKLRKKGYYIIVTPLQSRTMCQQLKQHGIHNFIPYYSLQQSNLGYFECYECMERQKKLDYKELDLYLNEVEKLDLIHDGKEIINSVCNHSTLYQCYADSDKCMLCDLNNIINTIKENGDF